MEIFRNLFTGALIGIANIIPGVSGGTLAVIMGVYDKIVGLSKIENLKKEWRFVLQLLIGIAFSILLLSKLFAFLFEKYAVAPSLVFFGIILGSLPMIYRTALDYCPLRDKKRRISPAAAFAFFLALAVMLVLVILELKGVSLDIEYTPSLAFTALLFFSGILSAVSMVLPGISGSLMMVVIGIYPLIINSLAGITDFESTPAQFKEYFGVLIPFGLGCGLGLLGGLHFVRIMLEKKPDIMYFAIFGLVFGSLFTVLPITEIVLGTELFIGILLAALCAFGTYKLSVMKI